jgi:hypothetical protein
MEFRPSLRSILKNAGSDCGTPRGSRNTRRRHSCSDVIPTKFLTNDDGSDNERIQFMPIKFNDSPQKTRRASLPNLFFANDEDPEDEMIKFMPINFGDSPQQSDNDLSARSASNDGDSESDTIKFMPIKFGDSPEKRRPSLPARFFHGTGNANDPVEFGDSQDQVRRPSLPAKFFSNKDEGETIKFIPIKFGDSPIPRKESPTKEDFKAISSLMSSLDGISSGSSSRRYDPDEDVKLQIEVDSPASELEDEIESPGKLSLDENLRFIPSPRAPSPAPSVGMASEVLRRLSLLELVQCESSHARSRSWQGYADSLSSMDLKPSFERESSSSKEKLEPEGFKFQSALEKIARRESMRRYGMFSRASMSTVDSEPDSTRSERDSPVLTIKLSIPETEEVDSSNWTKRSRLTSSRFGSSGQGGQAVPGMGISESELLALQSEHNAHCVV